MTMPSSFRDRDQAKFKETSSGETSVRVSQYDTGSILEGVSYDDVQVSYPSAVIELYEFYSNTNLVASVEVTYSDSSKQVLLRARRV